jgi:arginase
VVVFAFRDADSAAEYGAPDVRQTAMHVFDLPQVRRLGAASAARVALSALETRGLDGFWIHVDADVLNDDVMPAVDYRMPDGLSAEELTEVLAVLLASPLASGLEMMIYNPTFDDAKRSATRVLARAITAAFATVRGDEQG